MEFIDLKEQYRSYKAEIDADVLDAFQNAEFIGGRYVESLETELAEYVGVKHCISCGNGTDALQLAYMVYGVGRGDAVFCPDMTFVSSVEPAAMLGATPIFIDIDPASYNIDPEALERRISEIESDGSLKPKAVVAVDFLGNPADYSELERICSKHNLLLIEDGAQGMGGSYKGKKLCSFGDIATTSFFPSKPLGCYGDGGAVFTNDDEIAKLIRSIKVHGKGKSKYDNVRIGINSRLDNVQAAVLRIKLKHLDEEMRIRQELAAKYSKALASQYHVPYISDSCVSAFAQYVLLPRSSESGEAMIQKLKDKGIPSLSYYPKAMHEMPAFEYAAAFNEAGFDTALDYAHRNFAVPFSAFLANDDLGRIVQTLLEIA